jgi:hypothetical protein
MRDHFTSADYKADKEKRALARSGGFVYQFFDLLRVVSLLPYGGSVRFSQLLSGENILGKS